MESIIQFNWHGSDFFVEAASIQLAISPQEGQQCRATKATAGMFA